VADVGDEGTAAAIEIAASAVVPEIASLAADDEGEISGQLSVENVAVGVAMRRSDRTTPAGGDG